MSGYIKEVPMDFVGTGRWTVRITETLSKFDFSSLPLHCGFPRRLSRILQEPFWEATYEPRPRLPNPQLQHSLVPPGCTLAGHRTAGTVAAHGSPGVGGGASQRGPH